MTASLPDPRETSSSDTEGVAASVEPSTPVAPAAPRTPRRTSTAVDETPEASDAADSTAAAAATPAPKPRAPRAPRATTARTGSTAAARTPAAKKAAGRTAAAKKPATPRTTASKKPAASRGSAAPKTAAAAAAADAAVVSAPGAEDSAIVSAAGTEDVAVASRDGEQDATADSAAVAEDALETSLAADAPDASATAAAAAAAADEAEGTGALVNAPEVDALAADGSDDPSEQAPASPGATDAFADVVIPPRPPLPPRIDTPTSSGASIDEAPHAFPRIASAADGTDVSAVHLDSEGADEPPSSERFDATGTVVDPTPADIAVEEPATTPAPDASSADTTAHLDTETETADPSVVELITATPLETSRGDDSQDALDPADAGARRDGDEPGSDETEVGSASVADAEDPTPPDVRADDETADEAADASTGADVPEASDVPEAGLAGVQVADGTAADVHEADGTAADIDDGDAAAAEADAEVDGAATERDAARDEAVDSTSEPETRASDATTAVVSADLPAKDEPEEVEDADASVATETPALTLRHITKTFGDLRAVDAIDLTVPAGSFYGLVGPNGAGKTTTLSIIAGLLRADAGDVAINGIDARKRAREAKKLIGVLPDRLRTFDRLTGRQLLSYYGALRGLPGGLVESRTADLARAFDLVDALARPVSDYSAGMTKKVMLAGAMIHSPRLLVLDEPFEAVDPVSSGVILDILRTYVDHGGTVILSSHGMELVERVCSRVAVIVSGQVLAEGTVDEVRGEGTLEARFRELSGGLGDVEGLEWLHTFSA